MLRDTLISMRSHPACRAVTIEPELAVVVGARLRRGSPDDALAAVKWLAKRDDVDKKRIVAVGHLDGGPVALIAASREKEIDGVATIDAAGATGAELILLQQQHVLEEMKLAPALAARSAWFAEKQRVTFVGIPSSLSRCTA